MICYSSEIKNQHIINCLPNLMELLHLGVATFFNSIFIRSIVLEGQAKEMKLNFSLTCQSIT